MGCNSSKEAAHPAPQRPRERAACKTTARARGHAEHAPPKTTLPRTGYRRPGAPGSPAVGQKPWQEAQERRPARPSSTGDRTGDKEGRTSRGPA